ncbi:MAG: TonB-dependent receptor, partial [bacterium]|nr:TonB-dependent receptor [bacterium]
MTSVASLMMAPYGVALAQQAAPASPVAPQVETSTLDEVLVTAERQTRNLQTTPVAVTAVSGEQLAARGVQSIYGLQNLVPSLSIGQQTNGGGAGAAVFFLRGLGQARSGNGSEPAVALYLDDFYYPAGSANILKALDLEQVEVLRGPQGTLFGRNTIGGAIRYQTKKPSDQLGGFLEGTVGSYDRADINGAINLPLGDTLAVRLSAASLQTDGFQRRQTSPGRNGATQDRLGRIQLRYKPTADLMVDLSYEQAETEVAGSTVYVSTISATSPLAAIYNARNPGPDYDQSFASTCIQCAYGSLPIENSANAISRNWHGVIDYQATDWLRLKSLTGYNLTKDDFFNDIDASPLLIANQYGSTRVEAFSQELQALGDLGSRTHFVFGLYYYDEKLEQVSGQTLVTGVTIVNQDRTREALSAYGNITYELTDQLSVTGGLRVGHEDIKVSAVSSRGTSGSGDLGSDLTLPMVRVQYQWTPDVMSYISATRGFRGGGFTVAPNPSLPNAGVIAFDPEMVWSYEFGTRAEAFDGRLRLNPTVFYTDYSDIQIQRITGTTPVLENAGEAHVYGVELETMFAVTSKLRLTGTGSYLKAAY